MLPGAGTSIRPTLSDMNYPGSPDSGRWQPTTDDLMASIAEASAGRRTNCRVFLDEFVEEYVADRTREQVNVLWVDIVKNHPWYAEDLLYCVDATLLDCRQQIPDQVCDIAQAEADGGEVFREVSVEQWQAMGRSWLEDLRGRFRPVFDELSRS